MQYSVVIPFYNEADNTHGLFGELIPLCRKVSPECEIIAVDDGSIDGTFDSLKEIKADAPEMKIIRLEKRAGQSAALWAGIINSRGKVIITMDGDGQNDPADIPLLLDRIKDCDAVFGWRKDRRDPAVKKISSRVANAVRISFLGNDVHDTGCGLKAFKREVFSDMFPFSGMHRFFPSLLKMKGIPFAEVEVHHRPRIKGKTKYSVGNRLFKAFRDLLAVRWMKKNTISYTIKEVL